MAELKTPELDKMRVSQPLSQGIGEFIEWLDSQGMEIAQWMLPEGCRDKRLLPCGKSIKNLLAQYFEIDLTAIENERRAIIRAAQGK